MTASRFGDIFDMLQQPGILDLGLNLTIPHVLLSFRAVRTCRATPLFVSMLIGVLAIRSASLQGGVCCGCVLWLCSVAVRGGCVMWLC